MTGFFRYQISFRNLVIEYQQCLHHTKRRSKIYTDMEIKLNTLIMVLSLLVSSCATKKYSGLGSTEEEFIIAFKKSILMGCLNELTEDEFGKLLVTKYNDIGLYTEVAILYHSEAFFAKCMGVNLAKSLKSVDYPDVAGKKQGYSRCIDYAFFDKEVDSIARIRYKELGKGEMEYLEEG